MSWKKWSSVAGCAIALSGCAADAQCQDGQTLVDGVCIAEWSEADSGSAGSTANPIDGAAGSAGSSGSGNDAAASVCSGEFGTTCTSDGECACPAAYCAIQPGKTTGLCTATGCVEDPSVCPEGWSCLDLSMFQAGLPSICREP